VTYRCHVCRLELELNPGTHRLELAPLLDDQPGNGRMVSPSAFDAPNDDAARVESKPLYPGHRSARKPRVPRPLMSDSL
jgi:hypothetical protein